MVRQYSSVAVTTAMSGGVTSSATVITVDSTSGFPLTFPYTLVIDPDTASMELVEVTGAAGSNLTVTRGVDGTTGVAHLLGAVVRHDHSARDFQESRDHEAAVSNVHGVTSGSVVGTTMTQTLTNKTLSLASNTLTGTLAQFNAALSGDDFASLTGAETLTNKTLNLSSNTLTGTKAQFNAALSDGDFASQAGTETLTNKTIDIASNTLTGVAPLASPALTGNPTAPTATTGDNDTTIATTAFVQQEIAPLGLRQVVVFTASGTFTKATYPWLKYVRVKVVGGGGGGGGTAASGGSAAAGGGGGGYAEVIKAVASLGANETVTRGAGGAGGAAGDNDGSAGGTSSFGAHASATGGGGGGRASLWYNAGTAGAGTAGDILLPGGTGRIAPSLHTGIGGNAGGGMGNGGNATQAGGNYGGGGGGATTVAAATAGGAGANGVIVVELYG
jgi:hypothetical protein